MLNKPISIVGLALFLTLILNGVGLAILFQEPKLLNDMNQSIGGVLFKVVFTFLSLLVLLFVSMSDPTRSLWRLLLQNLAILLLISLIQLVLIPLLWSNALLEKEVFILLIRGLMMLSLVQLILAYKRAFDMRVEAQFLLQRVEREKLSIELNGLKLQLNPHFLFNALNTLNGLIRKDPEMAIRYNEKVSHLFRYILENRESALVSLKSELDFVQDFLDLYQNRFGEGLAYTVQIPQEFQDLKIPSLSLQLLVENAVKHNVITGDLPLHISIKLEGDYLMVQNNVNPKLDSESSTGIGLANLNKRCQLLLDDNLRIFQDSRLFQVWLPLMNAK